MSKQRVIYLHGFASSPRSSKAQFFAKKLSQKGFNVDVPDLAEGDFGHLTLSGQLRLVETLLAASPAIVFGSSMGGYLAALAADRHPEQVRKLVLLAPAFGFYNLWKKELGQENLETWREKGTISVFHYGEGREMPLSYGLMEDAAQFAAFPECRQPCLIFHGVNDKLVPVEQSRQYAVHHKNVDLREFQSGHELTDVLEDMWEAAREFVLEVGR